MAGFLDTGKAAQAHTHPLSDVTISELDDTTDLNTLLANGYYHQSHSAEASTALNYPAAVAGFLTVVRPVNVTAFAYQYYQTLKSGALYYRGYYYNAWSKWEQVVNNTTVSGASDPLAYFDSVKLLCEFPVRENGEISWPQGFSINKAADEIYVSNQNATELRIDVRTLSTGVRKSSKIITTDDNCWSEALPWFNNANGDLCFIIRPTGGDSTASSTYAIYNYTTGTKGATIPIKGFWRCDVNGDYFVSTDANTYTVPNFYIYDWASVKAGTPTLLATIPAQGGSNTPAKNQGMGWAGGYFFMVQGNQQESPAFQAWDSNGKLVLSRQFTRSSFQALVNKLKPGYLTNPNYIYEAEGGYNLDGKFLSSQIVNNNPSVTADGRVLILEHNHIDGALGVSQPATSYVYDTGWIPLTLINSFTAAYGPTPAVRRVGNEVMLRGNVVKNAITNYEACAILPTTAADGSTLKPPLKPVKGETFAQTSNTTSILHTRINDGTGGIEMYSSAATTVWRTLSGVRYFID